MKKLTKAYTAVAVSFLVNGLLYGSFAARLPSIQSKFSLNEFDLGLLMLCMSIGAIISFSLAGRWVDRMGAALISRSTAVASLIMIVAFGFSAEIWVLAISMFLFGGALGAWDVSMNAWGAEVEREYDRPILSGFHAMFSLGAGIGAGLGALYSKFGIGVSWHFLSIALLAGLTSFWLMNISWRPKPNSHSDKLKNTPIFSFPTLSLLPLCLVAFASSIGEGAIADWSAIFLVNVTNAAEHQAAIGYAFFSVSMVVMRMFGGTIISKLGPATVLRLSGITIVTGVIILITSTNYWIGWLAFAILGLGYALIVPIVFTRAANDPDRSPGEAVASIATLGYGGLLIGPPFIGFLSEIIGLQYALATLAFAATLVIAFASRAESSDISMQKEKEA